MIGPFRGEPGAKRPGAPVSVVALSRDAFDDPSLYSAEAKVADAVNVALALGMPLLVEGAPGCGKTMLGRAVAHELGWAAEFHAVKSTSRARDLFYAFDDVGRFRQAQVEKLDSPLPFVTYGALGRALLRAHRPEDVAHLLPRETSPQGFRLQATPTRSVVIVDEVDKAPRDFPNDLLHEIDRMTFEVPELQPTVANPWPLAPLDARERPFVVFTSNRERRLPEAFLRRCIYCFIDLPDAVRLEQIAAARLTAALGKDSAEASALIRDAVHFLSALREVEGSFEKVPGTAEFLNWSQAMVHAGGDLSLPLRSQKEPAIRTLGSLLKTEADVALAAAMLQDWSERGA